MSLPSFTEMHSCLFWEPNGDVGLAVFRPINFDWIIRFRKDSEALLMIKWCLKDWHFDGFHHAPSKKHLYFATYIRSQGCQPVRNFRILYGFYMQNTGVRIWPRKYGNWALSVLSLKVLLPEQSLPVLGSKSVRICGILCLRTFKYLFNHQNIQSSLFHM